MEVTKSANALLLSVERLPSGLTVDVIIQFTSEASVEDLALAINSYINLQSGYSDSNDRGDDMALGCTRLGPLAAHHKIVECGLRSGDTLTLREHSTVTSSTERLYAISLLDGAIADLVVHAGPQAGRRVSLATGSYVLGRDPQCRQSIVLEDASISRRHLRLDVNSRSVNISDLNSRNGFSVEGKLTRTSNITFDTNTQVEVGRSVISFCQHAPNLHGAGSTGGATYFNRAPRVSVPYHAPTMKIDAAPAQVNLSKLQLVGIWAPLAIALPAAVIFGQWELLLSMLLTPVSLLWSSIADRRAFQRSLTRYRCELDELREDLTKAARDECEKRRAAAPDAIEIAARAFESRPELWERRPVDRDFLSLRVGVTDLPAMFTVELESGDRNPLPDDAQLMLDTYRTVPMVPSMVNFREVGSLGIVGPEHSVDGLGLWLAIQAAVLHSPRELSIAAAIDPDQRHQWDWLKWLPHTRSEFSAMTSAHLADDTQTTSDLLARVAELVSFRRDYAKESHIVVPSLMLFIDEDLVDDRAVVSEILTSGPDVGVYVIWLGHVQRGLPGECNSIAILDQTVAQLTLVLSGGDLRIDDVSADAIDQHLALEIARAITSIRDVSTPRSRTTSPAAFNQPWMQTCGVASPEHMAATCRTSDGRPAAVGPFTWRTAP